MKNIVRSIQYYTDTLIHSLFHMLTEQHASAHFVRIAITWLDVWQAMIILNRNYWIPDLVDISAPVYYYIIFACILALLAITALVFYRVLWLSACVFAINGIFYLFLGISAMWFNDPPRASVGFSFFVTIISISAFWRKFLLIIQNGAIRKRN